MSLFSLSGPAFRYWANSSTNPHNASTGTFPPSRWIVYTVPYCVWTAASQYGYFVSIINKLEWGGEDRLWMDTDQFCDNYGATVSLNWQSVILLLITEMRAMREIINDPLSMSLLNSFMSVIDCSYLSFPGHGKVEGKAYCSRWLCGQRQGWIYVTWHIKDCEQFKMTYISLSGHWICKANRQLWRALWNDQLLWNFIQCITQIHLISCLLLSLLI